MELAGGSYDWSRKEKSCSDWTELQGCAEFKDIGWSCVDFPKGLVKTSGDNDISYVVEQNLC